MYNPRFEKEAFKKEVTNNVKTLFRRTVDEATPQQLFQAVSYAVKEVIIDDWLATQKKYDEDDPKMVYYMSMEFLMGRALGNNLINMTAYTEVKEALDEMGIDLNAIEDEEPDPALGNGGLGRLAACFLDSLATLGYAAYGCGIRYHYGMFKQKIEDGYQVEKPDNWLKDGNPFELRRPEYAKEVRFGGNIRVEYDEEGRTHFVQENYESVLAIPYDYPIVGYNNHVVNTLRIWDAEPIVDFQLDSFDRGDYHKAVEQQNLAKNIVEVLYPNDNHYAGKELRLKQQYFFISASIQAAIVKYKKKHDDITKLYEKVTFQMNDTHPTVAVAELMRILLDEEGLGWNEAWNITTKTCAYTNHTIMAEALEKWPIDLFSRLLPRIYQIIQEIDRRFVEQIRKTYPGDEGKVKRTKDWITDLALMSGLKRWADDEEALKEFMSIKYKNKERLAEYILEHNGIEVDPRSIFDVQVKRLHEYKRQLLNILHVMYLYNQVKEHPEKSFYPRTFIFGAKASAGYIRAKQIIKLINSVADVVNNDRSINGKLKMVFIEDYRVSNAEWIFAAADVSEQISTASKEASGTGNMKFMLNGAPTIGTMDGANVEIVEEVGIDNAFIFGLSSDEVIHFELNGGYNPMDIYNNDPDIRRVVDQLVDGTYAHGNTELYRDLYNSLLNTKSSSRADMYFILKDFRAYAQAQQEVEEAYRDKDRWAKMALLNTACCGKFSSDRTIQEYVEDIWHLDKITVEV